MTLAEQIAQWRALIAARAARRNELMQAAIDANRVNTTAELEEDAAAEAEIEAAEQHVTRLEAHQARLAVTAQAPQTTAASTAQTTITSVAAESAQTTTTINAATPARASRPPMQFSGKQTHAIIVHGNKEDQFLGQSFTRLAIAQMVSKMSGIPAEVVAQERWGKTNPVLAKLLDPTYRMRAANEVAGGGTKSGDWGAELVTIDNRYQGDFIEFLYSKTVFDKLGLRPAPANINIKGQDGAHVGYWVGEGKAIPVSPGDFMNVDLKPLKVAALTAISKELLRDSTPSAEALIRDSLAEASSQIIDTTFLGTAAATANVKPAGIFNGVSAVSSSGVDAAAVRADVAALVTKFITTKNATQLKWVMNPATALTLSLMYTSLGVREFPDITIEGGTFFGFPVIVGDNVSSSYLILVRPSDIYHIGDSGVQVDTSSEATIEMSSAPTGDLLAPTAASQAQVSMFQNDSVAIKVIRSTNYQKRRSGAAQFVDDVAYEINPAS